ncbi:hypothetical protein FSP39_019675 [Pinctada imbricata]|uniref:Uncharacterized protein n=1 Tax=Pinctada imbricata TaxID=66713 RepID=A0AA88XVH2_PINIB|nr:hypothetical protein FSP39_019675 [Pinctada imbricata]
MKLLDQSFFLYYRCASANECELLWYQKSSKRNECANFEPNNMYYAAFNCHFCCIEDGCNLASKPQKHTLYIP